MRIFAATVFLVVFSGYSDWHTETVDYEGGMHTSLVLDSSGNPHISYWILTSGYNVELRYARWNTSSWEIETVDSSYWCASQTSLALDTNDYPHIAYGDSEYANLKYAAWNGSEWKVEVVDSNSGDNASMALDSYGYPHISYSSLTPPNNVDLRYARWNGSVWEIEQVQTADDAGYGSSLELDSSDHPHISYIVLTFTSGIMNYVHWNGVSWQIENVCSIGPPGIIGINSSLALDSSQNPHITCTDKRTGEHSLKYNYRTGTSWEMSTVDSIGLFNSIILDQSDYAHISYYCTQDSSLRYACWNGSNWEIETVDSTGDVGMCTSIVLDSMGNPHISYMDYANDNLKYAYYYPTGIEDDSFHSELNITGVEPNPSAGTVSIHFEAPELSIASFSVFDLTGRLVRKIQEKEYAQGSHSVQFSCISPGIYFCRITAGDIIATQRFVVIQ